MSSTLSKIYGNTNLTLLTDLYQLTMAYGYWKNNMHDTESVFHMFFRKNPFGGPASYAVSAGLELLIDYINQFHFDQSDIDYLSTLNGSDGKPLFEKDFLTYLGNLKLSVTVDAIPEGEFVFANEPLVRVRGPILQCQLLETTLLNIINFQTLIATKAHRIVHVANGRSVAEFGLRRAQGFDGALAASRAAYIGGCSSTSNVLAGKIFGIPVSGTHAHSWVMSFDSEEEAFKKYTDVMPNNSTLLVDTYDTINGVKNAIKQGIELRENGFRLNAIRLDSGDLAALSKEARVLLDDAGFHDTKIVASNDLDEYKIRAIRDSGSDIDMFGVGTSLVTAADQPALGGVYKLGAIKTKDGWVNKIKKSSDPIKMTNPGILDVLRSYSRDVIVNKQCDMSEYKHYRSLLCRIFTDGKQVYSSPQLKDIRKNCVISDMDVNQSYLSGKYLVIVHPDLVAEKERLSKQ